MGLTPATGNEFDLGLSKDVIGQLQKTFARHPEIEEVLIFGSRARGTHAPGSDIDLAIQAPRLSQQAYSRLWNELDELPIAFKMDVIHLDTLDNQVLRDQIRRYGKRIYAKSD